MAYTKQTWQDLPSKTTPINASRLGHIEQGIYDAASTADTAASNASSAISGLADKVDKVEGKGLSTNDFTDALKTKLDNIETGAEVNVQSDWNQSDNSADDYIKNKPSLGTSAYKNSTSVVTDSSDVVESGAVKDIVGWGNKNKGQWINKNLGGDATAGYKLDNGGSSLIAKVNQNTSYTVSRKHTQGNRFRIVGFVNEPSSVASLSSEQLYSNNSADTYTVNSGSYNYLVFTYDSTTTISQDVAEAMIELGDTKTSYEPYHVSVEQTITQEIENALGYPLEKYNGADTVTISKGGTTSFTADLVGGFDSSAKYKLSFDITAISGFNSSSSLRLQIYEKSDTSVKILQSVNLTQAVGHYDIDFNPLVTLSDVSTLQIYIHSSETGTSATATLANISIVPPSVNERKCDNSVIAPVENQPTCQKDGGYVVGEHFQRGGKFCTATATIAYGEAFTLNANYAEGTIADYLGYTLTNAVALTAKLTLDSTYKKVAKRGSAIEFQVRFDVTENIVGDTDIISLGYTNFDNLFMYYPIFERTSPYKPITTNGCYLKANGYLHTAGTLPVGGYVISGCYLTNK